MNTDLLINDILIFNKRSLSLDERMEIIDRIIFLSKDFINNIDKNKRAFFHQNTLSNLTDKSLIYILMHGEESYAYKHFNIYNPPKINNDVFMFEKTDIDLKKRNFKKIMNLILYFIKLLLITILLTMIVSCTQRVNYPIFVDYRNGKDLHKTTILECVTFSPYTNHYEYLVVSSSGDNNKHNYFIIATDYFIDNLPAKLHLCGTPIPIDSALNFNEQIEKNIRSVKFYHDPKKFYKPKY